MTQQSAIIGGRFEIGEFIRQGGIGAVYRGTDLQTGDIVAIKRLRMESVSESPATLERFRREGEILRSLNHPYIVKMLDMVQERGQAYLVMEFIEGGTLSDLLRAEAHLPIRRALEIALDLSDALIRAHRLNVIHRDLKPANILIANDGTPRLTDFGVAHIAGSTVTSTGEVVGTYAYLPPEAISGLPLDHRADIWSFGAMLFEMLAGKLPFDATPLAALMNKILHAPLPILEELRPETPIALVDLVYRMLERDRDRRVQSMRAIGLELEMILQAQDSSTPRRIYMSDHENTPTSDAGVRTPASSQPGWPVSPSPFVGREEEIDEIMALIQKPDLRLLTLLGPGGIGKTRLALEIAHRRRNTSHGSVYFVSLAPLDDGAMIVPALAEAVNLTFSGQKNPRQQILDHLFDKHWLLVMDNFEHLIDSGAALVSEILRNCAHVRILATSRERLNIAEELTFQVGTMPVPDTGVDLELLDDFGAIRLFNQSAHRVRPDFEIDEANRADVIRILRQVHGMPLGIELAAAWLQMLSPAEIGDEIANSLDFLASELRDLPERHRSMRGVFEYSWNTLNEAQRITYRCLSIFRDGFTREAAQKVTGATLQSLIALVNKSLLTRDARSGRYMAHELLRQYAAEKLRDVPHEESRTRAAHATYYANLCERMDDEVWRRAPRQNADLVGQEFENLTLALQYCVDAQNAELAGQFLRHLYHYFNLKSRYQDAVAMFTQLIEHFGGGPVGAKIATLSGPRRLLVARSLVFAGMFYRNMAVYEESRAHALAGLETMLTDGVPYETVIALNTLGAIDYARGDYQNSILWYEKLMTYTRDRNVVDLGQNAQMRMSDIYVILGEYDRGREMMLEVLGQFRESGNIRGAGYVLALLGDVAHKVGEFKEAQAHFREALKFSQDSDDQRSIAVALVNLGRIASSIDEHADAIRLCKESIDLCRWIQHRWGEAFGYAHLGRAYYRAGMDAEAIQNCDHAIAICQEITNRWVSSFAHSYLAKALWRQGKPDEARDHLISAAQIAYGIRAYPLLLDCLILHAAQLYQQGTPIAEVSALLYFAHDHKVAEFETRQDAQDALRELRLSLETETAARQTASALSLEDAVQSLIG